MAQESWNCDTAEGSGCQPQEGLVLCSNNCGFLGCAATMNLCSKCYRELIAKKQGSSSEMSNLPPASNTSPVHLSPVGSEKSFLKSPISLSLPTSAEPIQQKMSFISSTAATNEISSVVIEVSNPPSSQLSANRLSTADLAPINSLLASGASVGKAIQAPLRKHSTIKCLMCKKRMGLLAFKCRCGDVFCASHRYSDRHGCPFDYKSAGREAIAKANPMVIAKKVERI